MTRVQMSRVYCTEYEDKGRKMLLSVCLMGFVNV